MRWLLLAALLVVFAGCEGDDELVVSAASSLTGPLTKCSGDKVKLAFGGSDALAAQIRKGVKPDVYAAANMKLPDALYAEGLTEEPLAFAFNELVIAVPDDSDIAAIGDLTRPGVKLAVGAATVPVGSYTEEVLSRLPGEQELKILDNVRSREPDVKGVVGKLTQAAADAGFVYRTDLVDGLKAVAVPPSLQPTVQYGVAVVNGASEDARRYVDDLRNGDCANALRSAGFGMP